MAWIFELTVALCLAGTFLVRLYEIELRRWSWMCVGVLPTAVAIFAATWLEARYTMQDTSTRVTGFGVVALTFVMYCCAVARLGAYRHRAQRCLRAISRGTFVLWGIVLAISVALGALGL